MLPVLLALPVSAALLIWMLRIKKDNPFPKYTVIKLLIAGVISGILASVITLLGAIISLVIQIGPENLPALFNAETAKEILDQLAAQGNTPLTWGSALLIFCRTFVLVGLAEEVMKFFCAKAVMKKEGVVRTWMDALICFAIVAIGFQASEDIGYAEGNVVLAIIRALTPFHFTFGVIMGYYCGLGKVKDNKSCTMLAIVLPAFIHTVFDYSLNMIRRSEDFGVIALAVLALMLILTVFMILKLRKWQKDKTLDVVI